MRIDLARRLARVEALFDRAGRFVRRLITCRKKQWIGNMSYWSSIRGYVDQSVGLRRSARARVPHDTALGRRAEALCERCGPVRLSARSGSGGSAGGGRRVRFALAVIGRGGLVKPIESGVYEVNDALRRDLGHAPQGEHASNLGGLIAADIASRIPGARAFIADPVVVDELDDVARVAGHPLFRRVSIFHALNQKATGPALCTGKRPGIRGYESDRRAHGRRYIGRRSSPGAGRRREQCAGRRRRTLSGSFRIASRRTVGRSLLRREIFGRRGAPNDMRSGRIVCVGRFEQRARDRRADEGRATTIAAE